MGKEKDGLSFGSGVQDGKEFNLTQVGRRVTGHMLDPERATQIQEQVRRILSTTKILISACSPSEEACSRLEAAITSLNGGEMSPKILAYARAKKLLEDAQKAISDYVENTIAQDLAQSDSLHTTQAWNNLRDHLYYVFSDFKKALRLALEEVKL